MSNNEERDQRVKNEIDYWRAKANENWERKCTAYRAEIERYKPYIGYSNDPVKGATSIFGFFKNKYGLMAVAVLCFEIWFFIDVPFSFLNNVIDLDVVMNNLKRIIPSLGEHIFTGDCRGCRPSFQLNYKDEMAYKIYVITLFFFFAPLKIFLLFKWLDSARLNRVYRIYVISPLTVVKGLSAGEDISEPVRLRNGHYKCSTKIYRSMFSRVAWSSVIILLSMLFFLPTLMGNELSSPLHAGFACLFVSISCCILKDYFIYFKLLIIAKSSNRRF